MVWDEENRLTNIAYPNGSLSTYTYSADNLRRKREETGVSLLEVWDGTQLLQEKDSATKAEVARYLLQNSSYSGLRAQRLASDNIWRFFGYDMQGNTRKLLNSDGNSEVRLLYPAFCQCKGVNSIIYDSLVSLYQGELVAGGNPQLGDKGGTRFLSLLMGQNQHALPAFDTLFKTLEREGTPPQTIIELGTSHGGFSIFLHLYALVSGAQFVTYDCPGFVPTYHPLFQRLQVDYRQADVLNDPVACAEIAALIGTRGQTLLLCDNGDKVREFALYAPFLKSGDVIFAHDYCVDSPTFERDYRDKIWSFCEVTEADLEPVCQQYHLTPFLQEVMAQAVWACRRKQDVQQRNV